jgi:CRP/FNR family transcriptional regulator, cyclic AMP receptor protein
MSADVLRSIPSLAVLESSDLEALESALDVREYSDGHTFIREGERGQTIYVIIEGTVDVVREEYSVEVLNELGRGDLFGLLALVDGEPRSATCRARGPCTVGAWTSTVTRLLFNQHAAIAFAFQIALAAQLTRDFRQLDKRVRERLGERWAIAPER